MNHEPDPAFLEHLRWQTESALRRRDRFARPVPHRSWSVVRSGLLALLCTFGGAGLVMGAERIQLDRQQELLLRGNRVELALAGHRVERAAKEAEMTEAQLASGLVGHSEVERVRYGFEQATGRMELLLLERDEIKMSGQAPDLSITAPVRGGRDYFSERSELQSHLTQRLLEIAERELELVESQFAVGFTSADGVEQQRLVRGELRAELEAQKSRRTLRADWIQGRITDDEARRSYRLVEVALERESVRREAAFAEQELERMRRRVSAGVISKRELGELEDRLKAARARIELLELERQLVEEGY